MHFNLKWPILFYFIIYIFSISSPITIYGLIFFLFLNSKWFFDKVYNELISQNILDIGYKHTYQNLDRGIIELFGPNGFAISIYKQSFLIKKIETIQVHLIDHHKIIRKLNLCTKNSLILQNVLINKMIFKILVKIKFFYSKMVSKYMSFKFLYDQI